MSFKHAVKVVLQRGLGFHRYLVLHSVFVALTMRFRRHEGSVLHFIARLRPDANVLDIGANVGTMTVLFARKCRQGRIFAFEPIPENFHAAQTVLGLFGVANARLFPLGVGERKASVTMVMPNAGPHVRLEGHSHVVETPAGSADEGTYYTVPLVALDELPELCDVRISAIKIDVEDHERFVLRGGRRLIERDRPLIYCELWGDANKRDCFALLDELGYDSFVAGGAGLEPYEAARHDQINFFFVPQERLAEYV